MSINKFFEFFGKNKPFFLRARIENSGFWIFELIVSIVILMIITLFLFKFSCNMIAMETDAINRLMAIDSIASHLDGSFAGKSVFDQNMSSFGQNKGVFKLNSKYYDMKIVKSNLPDSVKNWQKTSVLRVLSVSASCKSASGRENVINIIAKSPNGDY